MTVPGLNLRQLVRLHDGQQLLEAVDHFLLAFVVVTAGGRGGHPGAQALDRVRSGCLGGSVSGRPPRGVRRRTGFSEDAPERHGSGQEADGSLDDLMHRMEPGAADDQPGAHRGSPPA